MGLSARGGDGMIRDMHCRTQCVAEISGFFETCFDFSKMHVPNTEATLCFLRDSGLQFIVRIPPMYLLFPGYAALAWRWRSNILVSRKKLPAAALSEQKFALLYHLTAHQLYGISESWTHCVCEKFLNGKRIYFDPLDGTSELLASAERSSMSHAKLLRLTGLIIFIWKNQK